MKQCEGCGVEIPEDFQNLLCLKCYDKLAETSNKAAQPPTPEFVGELPPKGAGIKFGIKDPTYQENPEKEDKEQWIANIGIFQKNGVLLWKDTRTMYEYIKTYCLNKITQHPQYPKFIWRPKIVDVGCGIGLGANIMSQEADFVWGIDKNETTWRFAKEAFTRVKNGIYYSSQVTFDLIDIMKDTRDFMKFDLVVAIEIIEHIYDARKFLETLIKKFDKRKTGYEATEYFISTPNRNNLKLIDQNKPKNLYHVREWTSDELFDFLSEYFREVQMMNIDGTPIEKSNSHTPIMCKCSQPKL